MGAADGNGAASLSPAEVIELYREIGETERHFNDLESKYRFQAGAWALSAIAAIGFVALTPADLAGGLDRGLISAVIAILGAIGVTLIWNLDVRVYHQLLDSNFIDGLDLELAHKWLPRSRRRVLGKYSGNGNDRTKIKVLQHLKYFYCGLVCFMIAIAVSFTFLWGISRKQGLSDAWGFTVIALSMLSLGWPTLIYFGTKSIPINEWVQKQIARDDD